MGKIHCLLPWLSRIHSVSAFMIPLLMTSWDSLGCKQLYKGFLYVYSHISTHPKAKRKPSVRDTGIRIWKANGYSGNPQKSEWDYAIGSHYQDLNNYVQMDSHIVEGCHRGPPCGRRWGIFMKGKMPEELYYSSYSRECIMDSIVQRQLISSLTYNFLWLYHSVKAQKTSSRNQLDLCCPK